MLFYEKKFSESATYYELSLEYCRQDDPKFWANWAKALYWVEGGRSESIAKFQKAIAITWEEWEQSPRDPEVLGDLIDYHAMIGDVETTRRLIATSDSLTIDNAMLLYQIGSAYELIGDRGAALRYIADAVRHGIAVQEILSTHELKDLISDPRFVRMISAEPGHEEAQADSVR